MSPSPTRAAVDAEAPPTGFDNRIHVPGIWRCAKCQFRLIQSNLNAGDGSVTARDEPGIQCPNCAVPLWRVTWREEAEDLMRTQDETWDRALEAGKQYAPDRVCAFLRERAAWFDYEARHGGDWQHLKLREEECRWIEQAIRRGRYKEDGRPSWLVNAIPVDDGEAAA